MTLSHAMPSATELLPLLPELVLIDGAFALLIIDLFIGERHKVWTHFLSVLALGVYPKPLTDLMEPSIAQLAMQIANSKL